jgi:RNA polymerase primary sigma factor
VRTDEGVRRRGPWAAGDTGSRTHTLRRPTRDVVRERMLLRAARRGDFGARRRVVASHLSLVKAVASRYRDMGLPLDDLIQESSLGFLDAIDKYDPRRSGEFATYACFRVRRAIRNALTEQARLVRLPKQVVERQRIVARADAMLTAAAKGRRPSASQLAAETGLSPAAVTEARYAPVAPVSLDEPVLADGTTLESVVADPSAPDPQLEAMEREEAQLVRRAVARLPKQQREVVSRRYGFGGAAKTIAECAAELQLSPQRTRTIERDALYELRVNLAQAEIAR